MPLKERLKQAMQGPPAVSQAELARACGVKQPSVNGWLSGKAKSIRGPALLAAARRLGVNPDWLASGKGPMRAGELPERAEPSQLLRIDPETMVAAQRWVEFEEGLGIRYAPAQRARRLGEVLNLLLMDEGELSPTSAAAFIEQAKARGVTASGRSKRKKRA